MGGAIALLGLATFTIGVVTLIKPIDLLRIRTRVRAVQVLAVGVFVFLAGAVVAGSEKDTTSEATAPAKTQIALSTQSKPAASTASTTPTSPTIPREQAEFIQAVVAAQASFRVAENDMAKGGIRAERRRLICQVMPRMAVRNWIGKIARLSSNSEGKGVLEISMAKDVSVKTWNNSFSDITENTLIPTDSPLFKTVSALKVGNTVAFTGTFFQSDTDCVRESSLTVNGSVQQPEFIFRFDAVEKR